MAHVYDLLQNYSTSFRYLDFIFGTDDKYRAYRKRAAAEKAKAAHGKKLTKAQEDAIDAKLMEETEREGLLAAQAAEKSGWAGAFTKIAKVE